MERYKRRREKILRMKKHDKVYNKGKGTMKQKKIAIENLMKKHFFFMLHRLKMDRTKK